MNHERSTASMISSPRCGARTRDGHACKAPAVRESNRCRMHGGKGSGAPKGNKNAFKSGLFTKEMISSRKEVNRVLREGRYLLNSI